MPTEVKRSQSSAPSRFQKDPSRHYLLVQGDSPNHESKLDDYLSRVSLTDPAEDMYRVESEDRRVTGHRKMVLISRSKEDDELDNAAITAEIRGRDRQVETDESKGKETFHRGGLINPANH